MEGKIPREGNKIEKDRIIDRDGRMIEKDVLGGIEITGGETLNGGQQPRTIYLTSWQVHSRRNPFNQVLREENRVSSRCRLNRYYVTGQAFLISTAKRNQYSVLLIRYFFIQSI